jgi:parallel beta-helix repeat protein
VITVPKIGGTFTGAQHGTLAMQRAVDAAPNGTATSPTVIHVSGFCRVKPVVIKDRSHLVIEGDPIPVLAVGQCRDFGPFPDDLRSTLAADGSTPPSGSVGEVIKILGGTNISVQFLNIVDGALDSVAQPNYSFTNKLLSGFPLDQEDFGEEPHDGVEWRFSTKGFAFCNCVARNDEGLNLHGGTGHIVRQNLVTTNTNGIRPREGASSCLVERNSAVFNRLFHEDESPLGNGIRQIEGARCTIRENVACGNLDDGIVYNASDNGDLQCNRVESNGFATGLGGGLGAPVPGGGGVEFTGSDTNIVNRNLIQFNADNLLNKIRCSSSSGNMGCNVPSGCGIMTPATCDLGCVPPVDPFGLCALND